MKDFQWDVQVILVFYVFASTVLPNGLVSAEPRRLSRVKEITGCVCDTL